MNLCPGTIINEAVSLDSDKSDVLDADRRLRHSSQGTFRIPLESAESLELNDFSKVVHINRGMRVLRLIFRGWGADKSVEFDDAE